MGCVGSPTDVHRGKRRAVAPPGRRLTVGRGVALPLSVPLHSLGRQQSGRHWRCAVHGGRGPPYHSGSCSPSFAGYDLCGVPVRRRGPACSSRPPCGPAAGAGGRVTLRLPSRVGGGHPPCLGGGVALRPPRSRSGRRPAVPPSGSLRVAGALLRCARAVGAGVPPRSGGGRGAARGLLPWGSQLTCKPPLCPLGVGCGHGRVMRGAASFVFRCARCSGTPVWVRGGRSSRRCPYRVAVPPVGGGAPRPWGGGGPRLWLPCWGGCGGGGGGAPPRPLSGLCGRGGGGGWGGAFGPLAMPPVGQRGGGAAWRSRPRGPAIGQGGRALPPPPSTESRILTQSLPGAPHSPAVAARRWPAGGGREGQRSVVSGLRGRFPWVGNKAGVPWCRAVHGGRGHPYHSGSRPPGFSGHDLWAHLLFAAPI